jgi:hypothetical protein
MNCTGRYFAMLASRRLQRAHGMRLVSLISLSSTIPRGARVLNFSVRVSVHSCLGAAEPWIQTCLFILSKVCLTNGRTEVFVLISALNMSPTRFTTLMLAVIGTYFVTLMTSQRVSSQVECVGTNISRSLRLCNIQGGLKQERSGMFERGSKH